MYLGSYWIGFFKYRSPLQKSVTLFDISVNHYMQFVCDDVFVTWGVIVTIGFLFLLRSIGIRAGGIKWAITPLVNSFSKEIRFSGIIIASVFSSNTCVPLFLCGSDGLYDKLWLSTIFCLYIRLESIMLQNLLIMLFGISPIFCPLC